MPGGSGPSRSRHRDQRRCWLNPVLPIRCSSLRRVPSSILLPLVLFRLLVAYCVPPFCGCSLFCPSSGSSGRIIVGRSVHSPRNLRRLPRPLQQPGMAKVSVSSRPVVQERIISSSSPAINGITVIPWAAAICRSGLEMAPQTRVSTCNSTRRIIFREGSISGRISFHCCVITADSESASSICRAVSKTGASRVCQYGNAVLIGDPIPPADEEKQGLCQDGRYLQYVSISAKREDKVRWRQGRAGAYSCMVAPVLARRQLQDRYREGVRRTRPSCFGNAMPSFFSRRNRVVLWMPSSCAAARRL